jgi:hypothetical protein
MYQCGQFMRRSEGEVGELKTEDCQPMTRTVLAEIYTLLELESPPLRALQLCSWRELSQSRDEH